MGNKSSHVRSPPYANPSTTFIRPSSYSRPSESLYSTSAVARSSIPNYDGASPVERGMMYGKTKNRSPAPTPSSLYGKKSHSKAPTPTSLYSKPSTASTPTPTSLYSKKTNGAMPRGFARSSLSRSGRSSVELPSPFAISRTSADSAYSRSTPNGELTQSAMTSCVKCRMLFGDSSAVFCRDCGHPRPAGTNPSTATAQRVSEERNLFGKLAVAF